MGLNKELMKMHILLAFKGNVWGAKKMRLLALVAQI